MLRGDERIWSGDELRRAIADGRTLDQLNMRAGDRIVLSGASSGLGALGGAFSIVRTITLLLSLPFTIAGLIALLT